MICPHGNEAPEAPWDDCAQCEAIAEMRPFYLAELAHAVAVASGAIDLRPVIDDTQPELPAELLPRPAGTLAL